MSYAQISTDVADHIMTITIRRKSKMNALTIDTIAEIGQAHHEGLQNNEVKGFIITGEGEKAFAAGADIAEFANFTPEQGKEMAEKGHKVFNALESSPKPTLALINGFALGGGCELAMSCHLRVASDKARFGQPEVSLGLIPGYGGTQRLVQLIGKTKALEYLLTGDMITAAQAETLGLVNYIGEPNSIENTAKELLQKVFKKSPQAIGKTLDAVNAHFAEGVDGFQREIEQFGASFGTAEFKEGTTAFLEKRKPNF